METSRRTFLRGLTALAGLAVVSPKVLVPLVEDDAARLMRMAREGRVVGHAFRLTRPTSLVLPRYSLIDRCSFVLTGEADTLELLGEGGELVGCHISSCSFHRERRFDAPMVYLGAGETRLSGSIMVTGAMAGMRGEA
jgi:hypothetical protein